MRGISHSAPITCDDVEDEKAEPGGRDSVHDFGSGGVVDSLGAEKLYGLKAPGRSQTLANRRRTKKCSWKTKKTTAGRSYRGKL